jgi:hypothetical protein
MLPKNPLLGSLLEKTPLPHRVRESRFSSGAKHHLHAPLGAPRLADSTSRWILTDLHRVADIAPYQYPFLVSSRDAHCLRGQYGRHQKQNPRRLRWGMARWHGQSRSPNRKDIVTTHAPPKCSGVILFAAGCQADPQMIVRTNRLCKSLWVSSAQHEGLA